MKSIAERSIDLVAGRILYRDVGSGPVLVFVHGLFVDAGLWDAVVPVLSMHYRCIVPTLPLGAHTVAMKGDADLSPRGISRVIAELLDRLDLRDVTLIGNDTGGALCQIVIARHPQRIARLVLTNCDAFESFPPPSLVPVFAAIRIPGFLWALANGLRASLLRRLFFATVACSKPNRAWLQAVFEPLIGNSAVRRDLMKVIRSIARHETLEAAQMFARFVAPVLIVWGTADYFFSQSLAQRLARAFPHARLEFVTGARTFVPLDRPAALVASIEQFVASPAIA